MGHLQDRVALVTGGAQGIGALSSRSALGERGQADCATAEAGLQGLARTPAIELGPFGITCNESPPASWRPR